VRGRRVESLARRGKFIVIGLSGGLTLLIHLRMTGRLSLAAARRRHDSHDRVDLALDDGRVLVYHDTRKFGRWFLLGDAAARLGALGPEPLTGGLSARKFSGMLAAHGRMLKPLLLDQSFLAGLGNIYVDEALWEARLHPRQRGRELTETDGARLLRCIRAVLKRGIRKRGTSLGSGEANFAGPAGRRGRNQDGLRVFRRTGAPCPRCGAAITRIVVGQRSTHFCPRCQREKSRPGRAG
jgi:formamidopyrimidine-DNA glycosylase